MVYSSHNHHHHLFTGDSGYISIPRSSCYVGTARGSLRPLVHNLVEHFVAHLGECGIAG